MEEQPNNTNRDFRDGIKEPNRTPYETGLPQGVRDYRSNPEPIDYSKYWKKLIFYMRLPWLLLLIIFIIKIIQIIALIAASNDFLDSLQQAFSFIM